MALKLKITKAEYDALPDAIKTEYKADGDSYSLDVSGIEDTGALRRANDRLKQEKEDAEKARREAQQKLDALGDDAARKAGDIATLEKSWQDKMQTEVSKRDATIAAFRAGLQTAAVNELAGQLASKLSDHPAILMPHLKSRIVAEFDGEATVPTVRILGADGKVSAMSADDLQKEFASNKEFGAIIRASKASGGAGNAGGKSNSGGAANGGKNSDTQSDLSKASPRDLAAHLTAKKEAAENA